MELEQYPTMDEAIGRAVTLSKEHIGQRFYVAPVPCGHFVVVDESIKSQVEFKNTDYLISIQATLLTIKDMMSQKCGHTDSDECPCACHRDSGVVHSIACCEPCPECRRNIKRWKRADCFVQGEDDER